MGKKKNWKAGELRRNGLSRRYNGLRPHALKPSAWMNRMPDSLRFDRTARKLMAEFKREERANAL